MKNWWRTDEELMMNSWLHLDPCGHILTHLVKGWLSIKLLRTHKAISGLDWTGLDWMDHWTTSPLEHRSLSGANKIWHPHPTGKLLIWSFQIGLIKIWMKNIWQPITTNCTIIRTDTHLFVLNGAAKVYKRKDNLLANYIIYWPKWLTHMLWFECRIVGNISSWPIIQYSELTHMLWQFLSHLPLLTKVWTVVNALEVQSHRQAAAVT